MVALPALRPYQSLAVDAVERDLALGRSALVEAATGCHRAGQLILMFDGSTKRVEDVVVGDLLMGPDSSPRVVLALAHGQQEMVEIRPIKGDPWVVNLDHILTLKRTTKYQRGSKVRRDCKDGEIIDVTVREWLSWSRSMKHVYKLV